MQKPEIGVPNRVGEGWLARRVEPRFGGAAIQVGSVEATAAGDLALPG